VIVETDLQLDELDGTSASPPREYGPQPHEESAPIRRGWRVNHVVVAVLAVGLIVTGSLATVTIWARNNNEHHLLRQRVIEAGEVLKQSIPSLQTPLAAAAEVADATNGDPATFKRVMSSQVGPTARFRSASLWLADGSSVTPAAVLGDPPELAAQPPERIREYLNKSAQGTVPAQAKVLTLVDLLAQPTPRLGYSFPSISGNARYVAYGEIQLRADRFHGRPAGDAWADLQNAIYLGDHVAASSVLTASTPDLPLSGRTAQTVVNFGGAQFTVVMKSDHYLGGSLLERLPILIAFAGLLVTGSTAALVQRLLRRKEHAEQLSELLAQAADENARLYASQRTVAQVLQRSLLPDVLPLVPGLEFGVRYEPGVAGVDIGGDWYDVAPIDDDHVLMVVGDVSGRGLRAATVMASLRYAIRAYGADGDAPAEILRKVGNLLQVDRDGHFATVLCALVTLSDRRVTFANAGHPLPLLIDGDSATFVPMPVGVPVGVHPGHTYETATIRIPPNATLLAFTDGLFERRHESVDDGMERLRSAALLTYGPLEDQLTQLLDALSEGRADDTALLGVHWTP
jgi:serine phosphatase RsbU (regulator of sigma subunit)